MHRDRTKFCVVCGSSFDAQTAWHKYCSRKCSTRSEREREGIKLEIEGRHCRQCGTHFFPTSNNQQHCSLDCSKKSARESRSKFYEQKPEKYREYHQRAREKHGSDGNLKRFYVRFPEAPKACESCGENRVLDIAHKPEHRRDGAWRSKANTTWPDKVWILCPTCHALLDRMRYEPALLGLS